MSPIYAELVDFIASGPSQQAIASFQSSEAAKAGVADLIHREKTIGLTGNEKQELAACLQIEHLMRLIKSRARQQLGNASD